MVHRKCYLQLGHSEISTNASVGEWEDGETSCPCHLDHVAFQGRSPLSHQSPLLNRNKTWLFSSSCTPVRKHGCTSVCACEEHVQGRWECLFPLAEWTAGNCHQSAGGFVWKHQRGSSDSDCSEVCTNSSATSKHHVKVLMLCLTGYEDITDLEINVNKTRFYMKLILYIPYFIFNIIKDPLQCKFCFYMLS